MSTVVRAALTQTVNAYRSMPDRVENLDRLRGRLEEIRSANVEHHVDLVGEAARCGAHVVCLGELFTAPYFALHEDPLWRELAEDAADGPTVTALRAVARQHELLLVAPLYELDPRSGKRFNTAVVIGEDGTLLGKYRKTHIPRGANEAASFHETFYYERSDGALGESRANVSKNPYFPVFATRRGKLAVATCYDRHFPGVVRTLARQGAEIVFSPAVTFGEKSRRMWDMEFLVDAARHKVFIGGSNRAGAEPPWNVEYFGESYFAGPNGRIAPIASRDELVIADLDLDELRAGDPSGWDLARDSRPDIYD